VSPADPESDPDRPEHRDARILRQVNTAHQGAARRYGPSLDHGWIGRLKRAHFAVRAAVVAVATANVVLAAITIYGFFVSASGYDWSIYLEAGRRVFNGGLYAWEGVYAWSYSPLLAYLFAAITPIGLLGWGLLHVAALAALRNRWLVLGVLASWPFWADLYNGNTMIFVFVAAVLALRRSPVGTSAYLLLSLLMPRPLMLPLLVWILWKQKPWRVRFALMIVVYGLLVLATGQAGAWIGALTNVGGAVAVSSRDVGPELLLGGWWLWLGAVLAIALTLRGRIGLASLAASPYWLPQYLLMALLEVALPRRDVSLVQAAPDAATVRTMAD
jgi:hypothetical protein